MAFRRAHVPVVSGSCPLPLQALQYQQVLSGPDSCEVTAFPRILVCVLSYCGIPVIKPHWPSKPDAQGRSLLLPDPQDGKPNTGLRALASVGEPLYNNYFPVCGLFTQRSWDLILPRLHPSYHL